MFGCVLLEPASFGTTNGYTFAFSELQGAVSISIDNYTNKYPTPECETSLEYSWDFPVSTAASFSQSGTNPLKIDFDTTNFGALNLNTPLTLLLKVSRSNNPSLILKQKEIQVTILGDCKGNYSEL